MQSSILTVLLADTLFFKYGLALRNSARFIWIRMDLSYPQQTILSADLWRPYNQKEEKVKATYILLWIGEEGRKIFNSFEFSDEEKPKIGIIFDKFTTYNTF